MSKNRYNYTFDYFEFEYAQTNQREYSLYL